MQTSPSSLRLRLLGGVVLFALNVYICWAIFFNEVVWHYYSVEPIFFAMSKAIREHWPDMGWWRGSAFGYPFEYSYQPLMHHLVAAWAAMSGTTDARAYHVVLGVFCAFGPVAVYCLALRMTKSLGAGFTAGLVYSLLSAGGLLSRQIALAMGGWWYSRRLHVAVVYGEGPNVAGLALLPLALLFLDRAMERKTVGSWALAAVSMAAVVLTNIPATIALALGVVCYALAGEWKQWPWTWGRIVAIGMTGFLLFAPWLPPSALLLDVRNVAAMNPEGNLTAAKVPYLVGMVAALMAGWGVSQKFGVRRHIRFAWMFALVTSSVAMLSIHYGIDLIGQAQRLHVAMEIPIVLAVVFTGHALIRWNRAWRWGLGVLLVALVAMSAQRLHRRTNFIAANGDMAGRSESKIAEWMQQNAQGDRVLVTGATSFWLNYLTDDVQQVKGCCDQNVLIPAFRYFYPSITVPPRGATLETDPAVRWLEVLGVHYVAVSGPKTTDPYHDFAEHRKFDGMLKERWHDGDDFIYELPVSGSLAHAVAREELLPGDATEGIEERFLEAYRAGLMKVGRPEEKLQWEGTRDAVITGDLPRDLLFSVQIPAHPGWTASVGGRAVRLEHDALGFMVVDPHCDGPCEVRLHFDGGRERVVLVAGAGCAWAGLLAAWFVQRKKSAVQADAAS